MAMVELKCSACGAPLEEVGGKAVCPYCGASYEQEKTQTEREQAAGFEAELERAEAFLLLEHAEEALPLTQELVNKYPGEGRAWSAHLRANLLLLDLSMQEVAARFPETHFESATRGKFFPYSTRDLAGKNKFKRMDLEKMSPPVAAVAANYARANKCLAAAKQAAASLKKLRDPDENLFAQLKRTEDRFGRMSAMIDSSNRKYKRKYVIAYALVGIAFAALFFYFVITKL